MSFCLNKTIRWSRWSLQGVSREETTWYGTMKPLVTKESNSPTKTRQFGTNLFLTIPLTLLKLSFKENYNTTRPFKIIVTINQRFTSYIGFRFQLPHPLLCPCLSLIILPSVTVLNWGWGWGEDNFCKVGLYVVRRWFLKKCVDAIKLL